MTERSTTHPLRAALLGLVVLAVVAAGCSSKKSTAATTSTTAAAATTTTTATSATAAVTVVAPDPSGLADPSNFGQQTVVAVPKAGHPVVAFTYLKATGATNGDQLDTAAYDPTAKAWKAPVTLATGTFTRNGTATVAMAADPSTSTVALAYETEDASSTSTALKLAFSTDEGSTWTTDTVATGDAENPAIAMAGGKVAVSYYSNQTSSQIDVAETPALSATSTWTVTPAPVITGTQARDEQAGIAFDPAGTAHLAYNLAPDNGYDTVVAAWTVGASAAVKVFDSNNVQNDSSVVGLGFKGSEAFIVSSLVNSSSPTAGANEIFWLLTSSDDGATWSTASAIPPQTGASSPFSVSIAVTAAEVLLTYVPNGGSGGAACGEPSLALSTDLQHWTTCSPEGTTTANTPSIGSNEEPNDAAGPEGAFYAVFQNSSPGPGAPGGVLVWTQPPPSGSSGSSTTTTTSAGGSTTTTSSAGATTTTAAPG